jgi:hypothetical protein
MQNHRALEYPRGTVKMDKARIGKLLANQARLDFDKTSKTWTIVTLPANIILDMVVVKNGEAFDSTVKLGNADDDDLYITSGDFPVGAGLHDPMVLGIALSSKTTIKLVTSGNTTGSGTIWITWRPLL